MRTDFEDVKAYANTVFGHCEVIKKPSDISEESWIMQRDMFDLYVMFSFTTLERIGQSYNSMTREGVRYKLTRFIINTHPQMPPEIQAQFPLENLLPLNKLNWKPGKPPKLPPHHELIEKLKFAYTPAEKQAALDEIDFAFLRYHGEYFDESHRLVMSVTKLALAAGFQARRKIQRYYQSLQNDGLPLRILAHEIKSGTQQGIKYYYLILSQDQKTAEQILQEDQSLRRFLIKS